MTRTKIIIASVLKPVYEPRMYEKIASTLSKNPLADVHVIGYGQLDKLHGTKIEASGLGSFKRLSFKRLLAPWKVFQQLRQSKPDVAIACTHELLWAFFFYKILHPKTRLVYDLQENYYLNILHTQAFPALLRWPLALWVRLKERWLLSSFSLILVAENCYIHEMPFIRPKSVVIENKTVLDPQIQEAIASREKTDDTTLLFSGSLSPEYGIYEAIDLVEKLHHVDSSFRLEIVGYCADEKERQILLEYISNKSFIKATSFNQPLAYTEIQQAISRADWGLVAYRDNQATKHRIPTKLYDYMSYQLPVLSTMNNTWQELISAYDAGLCINYKQTHIDLLVRLLKMPGFYRDTAPPKDLEWDTEAERLERAIAVVSVQ